ncbi:hypothetical protein [Nocardia sp. AB354]|uniref:hypothetical protein n=1 Tax=Nocardia sp. AB354 TaxID=3413283 RepID=UPI003C1AA9AF
MFGLIDDDDLARVHFVVDTLTDEELCVGRGLQPGGPHSIQPVLSAGQRLDLRPTLGGQLGLTVVPVHDLRCAVGLHADFLGYSPEAEIVVRQRPVRQCLGEKVVCAEHLLGRGLRRRLLGTFRPEELPFAAVDDAVHLVDQRMARWLDTGVAQMPDCLAGRDHDRRPPLRDRPETVLLIGAEHVDPECAQHILHVGEFLIACQQLPIRADFAIGQSIGGGHEQNRAVLHRTLDCAGHEYQRFALAGFHFHRTRFHRVDGFRLFDPQHHSAGHFLADRAAPDDLHRRQQRLVLIAAVQAGHQHVVRKVGQALTFRNMLGGCPVEVDQQIDRLVAVAARHTGGVGETVVIGGRNALLVVHRRRMFLHGRCFGAVRLGPAGAFGSFLTGLLGSLLSLRGRMLFATGRSGFAASTGRSGFAASTGRSRFAASAGSSRLARSSWMGSCRCLRTGTVRDRRVFSGRARPGFRVRAVSCWRAGLFVNLADRAWRGARRELRRRRGLAHRLDRSGCGRLPCGDRLLGRWPLDRSRRLGMCSRPRRGGVGRCGTDGLPGLSTTGSVGRDRWALLA